MRDGVPMGHPPGVRHLRASRSIPAQCLRCASDRTWAAGIMTRLRIASQFVAVVAGACAALMLIDGQLIDFGVAAAICAASSVAAGLIAYAGGRRRRATPPGGGAGTSGRLRGPTNRRLTSPTSSARYAKARTKK